MTADIRRSGAVLLCLVAALVGCGRRGNHAAISGQVTLDGQPLEQGSILFVPIEGTQGVPTGAEIKAGQYRLSSTNGPPVGRNRVEITAVRPTGKMVPDPLGAPGSQRELFVSAVATRFNADSKLTCDVQAGDNTANFEVAGE
jgi:hypothetical protein